MGFSAIRAACALLALASWAGGPVAAADFPKPLAEEPTPAVLSLPGTYPDSWMFVHDLHFNSLLDGRAAIVDIAGKDRHLKGQIQVAQFGNILATTKASEIYVAETVYARLSRGARTDVITVWDKASLAPTGEIILPGGKRGQFVTQKNAFQFTNNEKWGLVFNFTPGASVTVVDLAGRKVLGDIDIPGCSLIYPTGPRGFMSLCADGTMTSIALDAAGKISATVTSKAFNDLDKDPLFMTPAMAGRTAWFVSFHGMIRGIDLSGAAARDLGAFSMGKAEGGAPEWRPGGWQVISAAGGRLYVLMSPNGKEGSHKDGGSEVWVIDPAKKARVARIPLKNMAISIETTQQAAPLLVAARTDGSLDVYDAATGKFRQTITAVAHDPMSLTAVSR